MKNNQIGRFPWGILAGVCGVLVFYTIVGTVASYIVLSIIAGRRRKAPGCLIPGISRYCLSATSCSEQDLLRPLCCILSARRGKEK